MQDPGTTDASTSRRRRRRRNADSGWPAKTATGHPPHHRSTWAPTKSTWLPKRRSNGTAGTVAPATPAAWAWSSTTCAFRVKSHLRLGDAFRESLSISPMDMDVGTDLILGWDWISSHNLQHLFQAGQVGPQHSVRRSCSWRSSPPPRAHPRRPSPRRSATRSCAASSARSCAIPRRSARHPTPRHRQRARAAHGRKGGHVRCRRNRPSTAASSMGWRSTAMARSCT